MYWHLSKGPGNVGYEWPRRRQLIDFDPNTMEGNGFYGTTRIIDAMKWGKGQHLSLIRMTNVEDEPTTDPPVYTMGQRRRILWDLPARKLFRKASRRVVRDLLTVHSPGAEIEDWIDDDTGDEDSERRNRIQRKARRVVEGREPPPKVLAVKTAIVRSTMSGPAPYLCWRTIFYARKANQLHGRSVNYNTMVETLVMEALIADGYSP